MDLATELQRIYNSEITVEIAWLWDGGIDLRVGDKMNGYLAEENVSSPAEILPWLQEAIAHFYPTSTYASALDGHQRAGGATHIQPSANRCSGVLPALRCSESGTQHG